VLENSDSEEEGSSSSCLDRKHRPAKRRRTILRNPTPGWNTYRGECLSKWKKDKLGTFECDILQTLSRLQDERGAHERLLAKPPPKINSLEFMERRFYNAAPITNHEVKRREKQQQYKADLQQRAIARTISSKSYKKKQALTNRYLSSRRCLMSLIKINLCCGPGEESHLESDPDNDPDSGNGVSSGETSIFTAQDIFSARTQILDCRNVSKWIKEQCLKSGPSGFHFKKMQMCDECFCDLHNIKVIYIPYIYILICF
jgi:hypothetical protein